MDERGVAMAVNDQETEADRKFPRDFVLKNTDIVDVANSFQ